MYHFPEGLYGDVRVELTESMKIGYEQFELLEQKKRSDQGAFIRVFDGKRWYYASCTDIGNIQKHIDALAQMTKPDPHIEENPIVSAFEVHKKTILTAPKQSLKRISTEKKKALLTDLFPLLEAKGIVHQKSYYYEERKHIQFYSSKGAALDFDKENCGIRVDIDIAFGQNKDRISISKSEPSFEKLAQSKSHFQSEIEKSLYYVEKAVPVEPGVYTVLMSPMATGIFTHESFGHKSEADFMVGDEAMKAAWPMGKKVASERVSIIDSGKIMGNGYVPFDDEGTEGKHNVIIQKGVLTGRLHSAATAAELGESLTGNARAINFEYEPIVRMTTTYIEAGETPLEEIISGTEKGLYIETVNHGSGMSTFTMAPARAYKIENGKITQPVRVSVVMGNVFETLNEVDAVSREFELLSFVGGGCGKMEQWPLPVGFGGPYIRVKKLNVQ
ncbi:MAG: TldD protein [Clostridiales bacterium]|jgi:TldD protein|nr:TldD protein [Clostridiales bacterium]